VTAGGEGRRGVTIAVLSTIVFFTVLALAITHAPGWPEVRRTFFNWSQFKSSMPEISIAFANRLQSWLLPFNARPNCWRVTAKDIATVCTLRKAVPRAITLG